MNYQNIPGTDLNPSVICLGTGAMGGGGIDDRVSAEILDRYLEAGGNFIDTAHCYSDWIPGERNRSEKFLGRWFGERGNRDKVILSTKGAHPSFDAMHIPRMTHKEVESDLDSSLSLLGVDRVNIYWLHRDDRNRPVEEILTMLNDFRRAGKIQYAGFSNWRLDRAELARKAAAEMGLPGFVASQNQWSLGQADASKGDPTWAYVDDPFIKWHRDHHFAAVPYTSQANGYFRRLEHGSIDQASNLVLGLFHHAENQRRFMRVQKVRKETSYTVSQIVLGYLISQPFPVFPIVGPKNAADLDDVLRAAEAKLAPEQVDYLYRGHS
jgi:aryl-alcohol dehydrogenase-like predicted oxidoreductase